MEWASEQMGFDFEGEGQDGLLAFQEEVRRETERINRQFGIFLNERVRVTLRGWDEEFEGKLLLNSLVWPERKTDEVPLRIGKITFDAADIESCHRMKGVRSDV